MKALQVAVLLLLALAETSHSGEQLCVTIESAVETPSYTVAAGDLLKIAFTHSIYGSRVEERFEVVDDSLVLVDVRYSESRLAEFYGFESAMRIGDWWVARPARRHYRSLDFRTSQKLPIRITFRNHILSIDEGAARLSLHACKHPVHG